VSEEKSSLNWIAALKLYRRFQTHLTSLKEVEYSHFAQHLTMLQEFRGNHTPEEVFKSIEVLMSNLQRHHRQGVHKFVIDNNLGPTGLRQILGLLQSFQDETDLNQRVLGLSQTGAVLQEARRYIEYFTNFCREFKALEQNLGRKIEDKLTNNPETQVSQLVDRDYANLEYEFHITTRTKEAIK
jgi:hypothetical protein